MYSQNMSAVAGYGDAIPEGSYRWRVSKIDKHDDTTFTIWSKCQTEPMVGRSVPDNIDLTNPTSLSKLKSYYKACGYEPGPEGHDPDSIMDAEFFSVVKHAQSKGQTYANLAPWSFRSLQEGPVQVEGPKA